MGNGEEDGECWLRVHRERRRIGHIYGLSSHLFTTVLIETATDNTDQWP